MAEIVNLRRARKAKERRRAETEAAANRAAFGVPKALKQEARAERELQQRRLEDHKLANPSENE
jgi:Domain of unknown function (DUF4169)